MFWSSVPCIRSHKSARHFVVNFVMGLIVGDRRFPGATILGGGSLLLPPTIPRLSRRLVQYIVMDSPSGLFWDFGSLYQRRCGVVSDALSRQPSSSSTSLRRLWLGVAAQECGTSLSDISAFPNVAASHHTQKSDCDINASYMQECGYEINVSHTQGSVCSGVLKSFPLRGGRLHKPTAPEAWSRDSRPAQPGTFNPGWSREPLEPDDTSSSR